MSVVLTDFRLFCMLALLTMPFAGLAEESNPADDPVNAPANNRWQEKFQLQSLDEIGMELSNPVSSLLRINNEFEYRMYQGSLAEAGDQTSIVYRFQPVIPIPLKNGNNILLRLTIPINGDQPVYAADDEYSPFLIRQIASTIPQDGTFEKSYLNHDHLAEVTFDIAYGGVSDSGFISMYGIAGEFPTSQDLSQARNHFLLGPEVAFGKKTSWGLYGAWLTHLTRISGTNEWDTNMTSVKIFFAYGLGNGWQIISNPVLAYDWEGDTDNKLFLPVGAGVAKTTHMGSVPIKLTFEIDKYLISPDSIGPDWLFTFSIAPVFGNPFQK